MSLNSAKLAQRLRRLETVVGRAQDVIWADAHEAEQRIADSARAHLVAVLDGKNPPARDAELAERDSATLRQWYRQQGLKYDAICAGARDRLLEKLSAMHGDPGHTGAAPGSLGADG